MSNTLQLLVSLAELHASISKLASLDLNLTLFSVVAFINMEPVIYLVKEKNKGGVSYLNCYVFNELLKVLFYLDTLLKFHLIKHHFLKL